MRFMGDTDIYLKDGYFKNIQFLKPGDKILNIKGEESEVAKVKTKKISEEIVSIKTYYSYENLSATKDLHVLAIKASDMECYLKSRGKMKYYCLPEKADNYPCNKCKNYVEKYIPSFVSIGDLQVKDYIARPHLNGEINTEKLDFSYISDKWDNIELEDDFLIVTKQGRVNGKKIIANIKMTKDLMRMFGFWLAEGSYLTSTIKIKDSYEGGTVGIAFTFNEKETDYIDFCEKTIKESFDENLHMGSSKLIGAIQIHFSSVILAKIFYSLFGSHSWGKSISKILMYLPPDLQNELLFGFILGDGHTKKDYIKTSKRKARNVRSISFSTVSPKLFSQLIHISRRCGFLVSKTFRKAIPEKHVRRAYVGNFYGPTVRQINDILKESVYNDKFKITRTQDAIVVDGMMFVKIKSKNIESVLDKKSFSISLKDDCGYVANGFGVDGSFLTNSVSCLRNVIKNKLTEKEILEVKNLLDSGYSTESVMKQYNVYEELVARVASGKIYHTDISEYICEREKSLKHTDRISEEQYLIIKKLFGLGYSMKFISKKFNVSGKVIRNIIENRGRYTKFADNASPSPENSTEESLERSL